ncbi:MAG: hypothetical protein ACP5RC_11555 [Halothiobacillaceae bacterium]
MSTTPTIQMAYDAIIANIKDPDELRDLAQQLEAEAVRLSGVTKSLKPQAAWPFPMRDAEGDDSGAEETSDVKSKAKAAWPF